jgi:hypothetical protein
MSSVDGCRPNSPSVSPLQPCPVCRVLADRVGELESECAGAKGGTPVAPPFALRAMRLLETGWAEGWELRPSPARRDWMDRDPHAYKCLPLIIANQWGWDVTCPTDVRVTWDGSPGPNGLGIKVDPRYAGAVKSQFGSGIVTFTPPWLFRTSPGWDLFAKGPSNSWKPNCVALEGIIETWWLNYTFTLNWKLIEPGTVTFAKGECVGQLVPVLHATFDGSSAIQGPIEPEIAAEMNNWAAERERRAGERIKTHSLYRRADGIDVHLVGVPVPCVEEATPRDSIATPSPAATDGSSLEDPSDDNCHSRKLPEPR